MTFVGMFSGSYCHGEEVAQRVAAELGFALVGDSILESASKRHSVSVERLRHTMEGPASILDAFRRDRGRNVAYVREALAEQVAAGGVVCHGFATHLLPKTVSHVFKVGLVASRAYRIEQAMRIDQVNEKKADKLIHGHDEQRLAWTQFLFDLGPWDERLYDEMVPMNQVSVDDAVAMLVERARRQVLSPTELSRSAAQDFMLAAQVGVAVAEAGHDVEVSAADGIVTMVINKYVMRAERLESELKRIASGVQGVQSVTTRLGPKFRPPGMYGDLDGYGPSRILLVDDEKEFVHTLSERLEARDMDAAVAYDGEDALSFVRGQAPEVMVLDLKMPGIDGLEVLRQVKREHVSVEVIILTGHGSELEQRRAEELGAFAYLHKPVDIELLARTMRQAYRKAAEAREAEALNDEAEASDNEATE
jgi:two-component system, OmpR family, response regulator CpxR